MLTRQLLSAALLSLLSTATIAQPITLAADEARPGRLAAYIYINAATGEVRLSRSPAGPRFDPLVFENMDWSCSGLWFMSVDNPARDPLLGREPFGSAIIHWADIPERTLITGYEVAYTTDLSLGDPIDPVAIPGFNLINTFTNNYEGDLDPGGSLASPVATMRIESLYGSEIWGSEFEPCGLVGFCGAWVYVDLEGSGLEFMLGDPDAGALDLDGDGLYDFGYTYSFEQPEPPRGRAGAALVRPASLGGQGTATTAPDAVEWFNQLNGPLTSYAGRYWFGGGDCIQRPYASLYLNLFGPSKTGCEIIDYTTDGLVDFADYLAFLGWYDTGDLRVDLNGDGVTDFPDYLIFLNFYDQCS